MTATLLQAHVAASSWSHWSTPSSICRIILPRNWVMVGYGSTSIPSALPYLCLWKCLTGEGCSRTRHCRLWWTSDALVKRAECWAKEIGLDNIHFLFANATISFRRLMSTYPGPLVLVSILCPDPHFKKRHHKRRFVQKPLVASIVDSLALGGKVFIQSDVFEVAVDMRYQFDEHSHVLEHRESIDPSILCDGDGWSVNNPMGIRTERELHADLEGARIYRRMYQKRS